jgi:hypothetical protein
MLRSYTGMAKLIVGGVIIAGIGGGFALSAQAPQTASSNDAVAALVAEVRGLRSELSQAASASLRSQLLVTRIQLQEQRLMHLDRQRSEVMAKRLEAEKMRVMFSGQVKQSQDQSTHGNDPKEREAAQNVVEGLKGLLQVTQATETTLRAEEDALLNSIATEQSRWTDFNNRLDELERSLPKSR